MKKFSRCVFVAVCFVVFCYVGSASAAAPTPNVNVVNTPWVRDVNTPGFQPFRAELNLTFSALNRQALIVTVPAGKRLVIEYVSWYAFTEVGTQIIYGSFRRGEFGPSMGYLQINPPHPSLSSAYTIQDGSQSVRLYFEPGEEVWASASATGDGGEISLSILGYYINIPQ